MDITSHTSDGSNTILSNIDRTRTSFFEHRTNSNVFIYWWSNSNTLFLASNERTSNIEPNRAFTKFTKLLIELTRTSCFEHRTNSNVFIYWKLNSNTLFLPSNDRIELSKTPIGWWRSGKVLLDRIFQTKSPFQAIHNLPSLIHRQKLTHISSS